MASVSDPSASRLRETFTPEWPDTASHYLVLYNMRPVSPVPSAGDTIKVDFRSGQGLSAIYKI